MTEAKEILKKYWGHDDFRPGQLAIIENVLNGRDTLALLPTGGGKSITYQIPAILKEGICIVVTPLIALMKDQVSKLLSLKIKALSIYSGMTYHEIEIALDNAVYGDFKFLYVSPERLETEIFKAKIQKMKVSLIAVDEAHCISQWGYDFRPSYLKIANLKEEKPNTTILALTATATPQVVEDIMEKLEFREKNIIKTSFTRKNLVFAVRNMEDKDGYLINALKKINGSGIIYVRNRKNTKELAEKLNKSGMVTDFYHAGLKHEIRNKKQEDWIKGRTKVICATNAFGMGIDKSDVRFVVHYNIPDSLEEYIQEAGRAGRDEKKAFAVLLFNKSDEIKIKQRLTVNFPEIAEIKKTYQALGNYFQLPIGGGKGVVFDFSLREFCSVYKLNILTAYNSLKILEHAGYVEMTDELNNRSRVYFTINRDDLYKFQVKNPSLDAFIKLLLRVYTGLFSDYVPIDESDLSRRTKLKRDDIYQYLVQLSKLNVIKYIPGKKTPLLIFREERLDDKNLTISPQHYKIKKQRYEERLFKIVDYAKNNQKCRNGLILDYFGEKHDKDCGNCDVCLGEITNGLTNYEFSEIRKTFISLLSERNIHPDEILNHTSHNQEKCIKALNIMLDSGDILYDGNHMLMLRQQ